MMTLIPSAEAIIMAFMTATISVFIISFRRKAQ